VVVGVSFGLLEFEGGREGETCLGDEEPDEYKHGETEGSEYEVGSVTLFAYVYCG